jgi:S1-C subfamily serine protease
MIAIIKFDAIAAFTLILTLASFAPPSLADSSGTGFVINQLGHLVTNNHVVSDLVQDPATGKLAEKLCSRMEISGGNYAGEAEIVGRDRLNDLAVLRMLNARPVARSNQGSSQPARSREGKWRSLGSELAEGNPDGIARSSPSRAQGNMRHTSRPGQFAVLLQDDLRPGEPVVAVGFPFSSSLSDEPKVVTGVLASRAGMMHDVTMLQHTAPINPGNSGGPLFDASGRVMGVNSSGLARKNQNVNFAIKADIVGALLASLNVPHHKSRRGREMRTEKIMADATAYTVKIICRD